MNPLGIIATAASLTLSIGLMFTSDAEVDTWGLVPGSTAYSTSTHPSSESLRG